MPRPGQAPNVTLLIGVNMVVYAATRDHITLDQNQTQRRAQPHQGSVGLSLSGIYLNLIVRRHLRFCRKTRAQPVGDSA